MFIGNLGLGKGVFRVLQSFPELLLGSWQLSVHNDLIIHPHSMKSFPVFTRFRDMMLTESFLGPLEVDNSASYHSSRNDEKV